MSYMPYALLLLSQPSPASSSSHVTPNLATLCLLRMVGLL